MRFYLLLLLALLGRSPGLAQADTLVGSTWLAPPDSFSRARFWGVAGVGATIYGSVSYGLYQSWYRQYELGPFHTFDDAGEWLQMDKVGHLYTTYFETRLLYGGARWTGMSPRAARWTAFGVANLLQGTVEVMDGFSNKWGFSWTDMAANVAGGLLFVVQDAQWGEQRLLLKQSSYQQPHPRATLVATNGEGSAQLAERSRDLFGQHPAERLLKDYNASAFWLSANVRSFWPESRWPRWLNVAAGYGAQNMYGGFRNEWTDEAGFTYELDAAAYPRYRQFFLSVDADFMRIRTRKRWVKILLSIANCFKLPAPVLELTSRGKLKLHPFYF